MKKGTNLLLWICIASFILVIGIYIGRNTNNNYVQLVENTDAPSYWSETDATEQTDYRLDINTATKRQLMELPGFGEVLAQRIIDYRTENGPFSSVYDLLEVNGIGEKKLEEIMDQIKAGG